MINFFFFFFFFLIGGCCGSGCMAIGEGTCNKDFDNNNNRTYNMNLGMMEIHGMEDDIVPYKGSYWFVYIYKYIYILIIIIIKHII